ncbi:hypothetical protein ZWY2020_050893 [Hordeum vulgare]|nr:hypothetical protein ZWY2020_050893 [Hordeum vulgare]
MQIWVHDDLPEEWQPTQLFKPKVINLGSGRFMVVDFLDAMQFDKDCNEMYVEKQFALFTGKERRGEARPGRRCQDGSLPLCALLIVLLCMAASLAEGRRGGGRSFIGGGSVGARGRASGSPRGLSGGTWAACVGSSLLVAADML